MYDAMNIEDVLMRKRWLGIIRATAPFSLTAIDRAPSVVNPDNLFNDKSEIFSYKSPTMAFFISTPSVQP